MSAISLYQYIEGFDLLAVHYHTMYGAGSLRHVSELPPEYRARFKRFGLPVDFTQAEIIQPFEHPAPGGFWLYYDEDQVA